MLFEAWPKNFKRCRDELQLSNDTFTYTPTNCRQWLTKASEYYRSALPGHITCGLRTSGTGASADSSGGGTGYLSGEQPAAHILTAEHLANPAQHSNARAVRASGLLSL